MALAAAGAGLLAGGAYIDAKYHITKDLKTLYHLKKIERQSAQTAAKGRLSPYCTLEDAVAKVPPQHEAIWSRTGCYTYRDLLTNVNRYAQYFLTLGIGPGDVVSLYLTNHPEFFMVIYAIWALGAYPSMINYHLGGEGIMHCLKLSDSKVLLVDEDTDCQSRVNEILTQITETGNQVIVLNTQKRSEIATFAPTRPADSYRRTAQPGSPACLIFTSGTTGFPKACPFELARMHRSNIGAGNGVLSGEPYGINSRWYNCMPYYHGTGVMSATGHLANGSTVCIGKRFRVSTFWDDVRDSRATGFVYVGEVARYLLAQPESPRDKDHRLKVVFGNGLRPDVWKAFRDRFGIELIGEFFSSTEGVLNLLNRCHGDFLATAVGHHGAIFRFLTRNTHFAAETDPDNSKELLRDGNGRCVGKPLAEGGEILVAVPSKSGDSGFAGYRKNEKATHARFTADVFQKGDLFYRSGDALRRDEDGRWFFMDRLGDTFRWKSENVSTTEVSVAVGEFPGVHEANVYGVLVPGHDGRAGCAAVYINGGPSNAHSFDWVGLARHTRAKLPKYAVPLFVRVLEGEVHGTHNHKQNKVPLREQGIDLDKVDKSDRLLWLPPTSDRYVEFTKSDWEKLQSTKARL